jgi:uncharacterized protein YeaO (DUF488 family)
MTAPPIGIVRAYDGVPADRQRILIDRLWPRGVKKEDSPIDEWLKDAAPSTELRRWYGHDPAKFDDFARRYRDELSRTPGSDAVDRLLRLVECAPVALVTATRDVEHSGARVLRDHLLDVRARRGRTRRRTGSR